MNKHNGYYVAQYRSTITGKTMAQAYNIPMSNNLKGYFDHINPNMELLSINACPTWKQAQEIARAWNDEAKKSDDFALLL